MTNTFKVGDKVRCIRASSMQGLERGVEYTIAGTYDRSPYGGAGPYVKVEGKTQFFYADRFELVSTAPAPGAIDLKALQPGDKVTLSITVTVSGAADYDGDVELAGNPFGMSYLYAHEGPYVGTVERAPPKPLAVGDEVTTVAGTKATIKAIDGDRAWVALANGGHSVRELKNLKRAA